VHAEISMTCFLDREIPNGGYVRILAESLLWEERLGKTRIGTTEGLTTCMEPHRGWTIASSSWIFLRKRWLDREQNLITVIQEKTKRTKEKEEAEYRSPTWSILQALQKINKAKRFEDEAVMSAPPFFQLAGRGDVMFWREDDVLTVVVWESLSESEQEQWSKKMGKSKDSVVWCRSREKDEEQRLFEVDGKEIFSNRSKQTKAEAGEKMDKKKAKGQSVHWKAWWLQSNIKCAVSEEYASCWVHQDCHVADEEKAALKKVAGVSGGKDECQVRLKGRVCDYWMGTEIGMLRGCGFHDQVTAGDGSDKKGKMGAGYNNLRRKKKKQQCKVGRGEEGSSSNQPELAAFLLALRDTLIEELLLYLCDNKSLLKAVNWWIVEGGKATLVGAPDTDILAAAVKILRKRIAAGTATFLVKVKAHRGEPANEGSDILAEKALSDPKVGKEWCQRTN